MREPTRVKFEETLGDTIEALHRMQRDLDTEKFEEENKSLKREQDEREKKEHQLMESLNSSVQRLCHTLDRIEQALTRISLQGVNVHK
jgi:hypothetical protein